MKHLKRIILLGWTALLSCSYSSAQFHTLGKDWQVKTVPEKKSHPSDTRNVKTDSLVCIAPKEEREKNRVGSAMMALPLENIFVTSPYGYRVHPVTGKYKLHNGIDLRARFEKVYSMLPGKVYKIGADNLSGKYVIIATGNYLISYCHLSEIKVGKGHMVAAGEVIAVSGKSGRVSGPHLHLTVKSNQKCINPAILLNLIEKKRSGLTT